ncbi:hypothetical protein F5X98DRAFT_350331 [Xylaria grammica]|nr:hypothetical protein F5X98DRAFT_350331 [Xylaria grammica]
MNSQAALFSILRAALRYTSSWVFFQRIRGWERGGLGLGSRGRARTGTGNGHGHWQHGIESGMNRMERRSFPFSLLSR